MNEYGPGLRFANGGEAELAEVIGVYGERLLRYAASILCNYQDAEDVVQLTFLSAYEKRGGFDGEHLSAWLHKITYNYCVNRLKRRRPLLFGDISEIGAGSVNPFADAPVNENLKEALGRLKAKDRALLYGRVIHEQSYEELSEIMGKTPVALRKQYERVKRRLAKSLENPFERSGLKHEQI